MSRLGNKGTVIDLTILFTTVVAMVFIGFIFHKINDQFYTELTESKFNSTHVEAVSDSGENYHDTMINAIPWLIVMLGLASWVLAFLIPTHPIFFPFSVIVLIIYEVIAVLFTNLMWKFLQTPEIVSIANEHTLTAEMVKFFPHIIGFIGVGIMIVMYSKRGNLE